MDQELIDFEPDYAVPPGETLLEALEEAGLTQAELSRRAEISPKHTNRIIKGHAALTPDVALKLERVLGIPSRFWNALEANYRARLARLAERQPTNEDLAWLKELPWRELQRRAHLQPGDDEASLIAEAKRFFGVASASAWNEVWKSPAASFRQSSAHKVDHGALASWIRITEIQAANTDCALYTESGFRELLQRIRSKTASPPTDVGAWLRRVGSAVGVAMVVEPEIKGARVSGAAYWHTGKPVIALSLRYRSDDQFWFSLFHEAGHILLHPRRGRFIDLGIASNSGQVSDSHANARFELEANRFAASTLIPEEHQERLGRLKTLNEIRHFADEIGIAAGIVVGRLQFEGQLPHNVGNGLKRSVIPSPAR